MLSEFYFEIRYIRVKRRGLQMLLQKSTGKSHSSYELLWDIFIGFNLVGRIAG